ncbi:MAG: lytic transglycosylase domain-containing protein [Lentisphaerae bacterium]|nr:lytic transglycosylase domain-containing protein [Lentisphaerota bacterium]MBE6389168.1 lytic transglycosylase domain-containing protein [Lentisphaerota bacterium]
MKKSKSAIGAWCIRIAVLAVLTILAYLILSERVRNSRPLFIDDTLYAEEIAYAAKKYQLPPELIRALIRRESGFDKNAVGGAGEIGLMQILPQGAVAEWARIKKCPMPSKRELFDIKTNLDIGCWYLARAAGYWKNYRCYRELALAEYNAGRKNAERWKPRTTNGDVIKKIDFPATRKYVSEIMSHYRKYLLNKKQ